MIKAQELRIGNWCIDKEDGNFYQIPSGLSINNSHLLDPIPLTEEILLKCGAYNDEGFDGNVLDLPSGVSFGWGSDGIMYYRGNLEGVWTDVLKEIATVHDFQNLVYSLTGEELQIKL